MAIQKNITIDGIDVPFKASAAVPRLYRLKFRRDIYQDFAALQKSVGENTEKSSGFSLMTTCCKCIILFTKQTLQNSLMSLTSEYANTTRKPI